MAGQTKQSNLAQRKATVASFSDEWASFYFAYLGKESISRTDCFVDRYEYLKKEKKKKLKKVNLKCSPKSIFIDEVLSRNLRITQSMKFNLYKRNLESSLFSSDFEKYMKCLVRHGIRLFILKFLIDFRWQLSWRFGF